MAPSGGFAVALRAARHAGVTDDAKGAGSPEPRALLRAAFDSAVSRCRPGDELHRHLPGASANGRIVLLGAGKATGKMAEIAEDYYLRTLPADRLGGIVVVPHGDPSRFRRVTRLQASHPLPDRSSVDAAHAMLAAVRNLREQDRVVMLLSGGASSLLCAPVDGITLEDKRKTIEALFGAAVPIRELNAARKVLSDIKGGKLALACLPAPVTTLAISDVVGDDPAVIGSAPTVFTDSDHAEARRVLLQHAALLPEAVVAVAKRPAVTMPQPPGDYHVVACPMDALESAAAVVRRHGYAVTILGDDIQGSAREQARQMAAALPRSDGERLALLSGGEVTVGVPSASAPGYGGPNREFALALALALGRRTKISALIADTDGIDGQSGRNGPVAGAIVDETTATRAAALGMDGHDYLDRHDSGSFFETLGDEVVTGATQTNVNDFRLVLVN